MNLFPVFRHKYFVYSLSLLFFIVSCTTSGVEISSENRSFDYSSFELFKSNTDFIESLDLHSLAFAKITTLERNRLILDGINLELGTNVTMPEIALQLTDYGPEEIIEIGLANQWMDDLDVQLIDNFIADLESNDFDLAITNFENSILSLNIADEKFEKLNTMANILESINYQYPNTFVDDSLEKNGWRCALATLALTAATAGLATCATVVACAAAVAIHVGALHNFMDQCLTKLEPTITDQ
jgi:hypothetical protein